MKTTTILLALLVAGCGATGGGASFDLSPAPKKVEVTPAETSSAEVGVVSLISDAIASLDLTSDQNRALTGLVSDMQEKHARVQDARKQLSMDMATSVESGGVDENALEADAQALGKARADMAPAEGHALEELHRILTPDQRKKVAAAMLARADKLPTDDATSRYGNWRSDLEISIEQDQKIQPKLDAETSITTSARAEHDAWQSRLRATAAAFPQEQFSASTYLDPDVAKTTVARVRRVIAFLKVVVPLLNEKQQKLAAQNLRAEVGVK